jgi:hypothetical protein
VKKSSKIITLVSISVMVCLSLVVLEVQTKVLRRAFDNFVLDNKEHYLPCDKLPTDIEVVQVVQEHHDVIETIEQVNPGFVSVEIDSTTCPGRADLLIWYATHANRLEIERIIDADTFFGIPYRLNNW